jgi:hypothetical protein
LLTAFPVTLKPAEESVIEYEAAIFSEFQMRQRVYSSASRLFENPGPRDPQALCKLSGVQDFKSGIELALFGHN